MLAQTFGPGVAGRAYVSQSMFDWRYNGRDMYLYCTTIFPSRGLQKRWRSEDGDDMWIEIFNSLAFFHVLEQETRRLGKFLGVHKVNYGQREVIHGFSPDDNIRSQLINPATLKPMTFWIEREWRGIWTPAAYPIKPEAIVAPELRKYCRLLREMKSPPIAA
jgi:hypothetical protein